MKQEIIQLLEAKDYKSIRDYINALNSANIAEILEELDETNLLLVFRLLTKDHAVETFAYLSNETQQLLISKITDTEIKHLDRKSVV